MMKHLRNLSLSGALMALMGVFVFALSPGSATAQPGANCAFSSTPGIFFDELTPASDGITVSGTGINITDMNVYVDITHTWVGDMTITLTSPLGTSVVLYDQVCGNVDDMTVEWDDEAADANGTNCPPVGVFEIPLNALSAFDGQPLDGTWTLDIVDNVGGDDGTLNNWCLIPTPLPPPAPGGACAGFQSSPSAPISNALPPTADVITVSGSGIAALADLNVYANISHTWVGDMTIELTSPAGTVVTLYDATCGNVDDMDIEWDDEAADANGTNCPPAGVFEIPFSALSAFDGEAFDGNWTLSITDNVGGDDGTLNNWCLIPTSGAPAAPGDDCGLYTSSPSAPISNSLPATTDVISVGGSPGTLADLNVYANISHTWVGDMTIELTSPAGTVVTLYDAICGNVDDMDVEWDDEATDANGTNCPPVGVFEIPFSALSAFDGEDFAGNWTLTVTDGVGGDDGTLNSWCLIPDLIPPSPGASCDFTSAPGTLISDINPTTTDIINVALGAEIVTDLNVYVDISHSWVGDMTISLESPTGTVVTLYDGLCGSVDDMTVEWDDEAADPAGTTCPPIGVFELPLNALSAFDAESVDGDWTLSITDNAGGDDGTLNSWCLVLETAPAPCAAPTLTFNQSNTDCIAGTFDWSLDIGADGDATDYDVFVQGPLGPDCGVGQGTAGFPADPTCEATVCAIDGFCCSTSWDGICAGIASDPLQVGTDCDGCVGGVAPAPTFIGTFTGGSTGIALGSFNFGTGASILVQHNDNAVCNQTTPVSNVEVCGCTDPAAVNTDPLATVDDGSCVYPPANDDCATASSLGIAPYPTEANTLGNLQGATASGGFASCGPTVDSFFDVFYEITISDENHYIVNVDPVSSGPLSVEVLDACGGTVVDCGSATGPFCDDGQITAGFPSDPACEAAVCAIDGFCCSNTWDGICAGLAETEPACAGCLAPATDEVNLLLENLAPGTYYIRVGNNGVSPELANSFFLINVQSFPTAQVQDNPANPLYACNQTGFQLEDFVGAEPQTTPGLGILDYEWLVAEEGGGTLTEWERGEPNYASRCIWLGMEYGKTYNVFVRLLIDHPVFGPIWGVYQGDYQTPFDVGASACTISTATNVTPTEVRPNYTPTNAAGNDYALCDFAVAFNVSGSENFRWSFSADGIFDNAEDIVYTRGSGNPSVRLSWVDGLVPGTTYQVGVEVQVDGSWSGYSTILPVTLALPPNTVQLRNPFCGANPLTTSYVLSETVCAADSYTFEFVNQAGGATSTFTSGNYVCFLNNLSPAVGPGTYDVRVKVSQGGVEGDFGPVCTVTIPGPGAPTSGDIAAQREVSETGAMLFPNPNAGQEVRVNLDGLSAGNHEVMIAVYDIYGKQVSAQGFGHEGTSLSRLVRFDQGLAMGMYMVQIVVDGESFATERLIVK